MKRSRSPPRRTRTRTAAPPPAEAPLTTLANDSRLIVQSLPHDLTVPAKKVPFGRLLEFLVIRPRIFEWKEAASFSLSFAFSFPPLWYARSQLR